MDNSTLNSLLQEYEQKRINANILLENRKKELYKKYPELSDIENEINLLSINKIKLILSSNKSEFKDINLKIDKLKSKKNKLLKSFNIPDNYFEPIYECNTCKDTGYINKNNKNVMCNCLKQKLFNLEYNKSNIGNLNIENFSTFSIKYYSDKIDEEKYGVSISPKENIKKIKELSMKFIDNFDDPNQKNLLFTGDTGLGKTFLCNCIAYELLKREKTVIYKTAFELFDTMLMPQL